MTDKLIDNVKACFKEHGELTKENRILKVELIKLTQIINGKEYQDRPQKMDLGRKINEVIGTLNQVIDEINTR